MKSLSRRECWKVSVARWDIYGDGGVRHRVTGLFDEGFEGIAHGVGCLTIGFVVVTIGRCSISLDRHAELVPLVNTIRFDELLFGFFVAGYRWEVKLSNDIGPCLFHVVSLLKCLRASDGSPPCVTHTALLDI